MSAPILFGFCAGPMRLHAAQTSGAGNNYPCLFNSRRMQELISQYRRPS